MTLLQKIQEQGEIKSNNERQTFGSVYIKNKF